MARTEAERSAQARWNAANPERLKAAQQRYRERNRERQSAAALARYYAKHEVNKETQKLRARERVRRRGTAGKWHGTPRSLREKVKSLTHWSDMGVRGAIKQETFREASADHDAWLDSLDELGGC
jgi:hypothetical protein